MPTVSGSGGAKTFSVSPGDKLTVNNFGAFGTGATPATPAELDTLHFLGAAMTAPNLLLAQAGANVVVTFEGVPATQVTLTNVTIEQLANIAGAGNFQFAGEAAVTDSVDVWNAGQTGSSVDQPNVTTFLNDLANTVNGFNASADVINGQGGNDILAGLSGNDILRGGEGNDTLNGGTGADRLVGGNGNDTYVVDDAGDVVVEANAGGGTDTVQASIAYALGENIENLTLTGHAAINGTGNGLANTILGNNADNGLSGGGGDDALEGNTGNDTVTGGDGNDALGGGVGNDSLDGGSGADKMNGGRGDDAYAVDNVGDQAIETVRNSSGGGIDVVTSSVSFVLGDNLDDLLLTGSATSGTGNAQANHIAGTNSGNTLAGEGGDDVINGNGGVDLASGGAGNDTLNGDSGNDTLNGDAGDDLLFGGSNIDSLQGGSGNDQLDGGTSGDTMAGGAGNDSYIVDSIDDQVVEALTTAQGGGVDTVYSRVDFTLGDNLENLTLTAGYGYQLTAHGNDLDNIINGGDGLNQLYGGGGNDTIIGGLLANLYGEDGDDRLVLTSTFPLAIDGGKGIDTVALDLLGPEVNIVGGTIEINDVSGGNANEVLLSRGAVYSAVQYGGSEIPDTVFLQGDAVDKATFADNGWVLEGTFSDPSGVAGDYAKYTSSIYGRDLTVFIDTDMAVTRPGAPPETPLPDISKLDGTNGFTFLGTSLGAASAGAPNGGAFDEIIVGSSDPGGIVAYMFGGNFQNPVITPLNAARFTDSTTGPHAGGAVSSAGDINGDGYDDLMIGDFEANGGKGQATILFGSWRGVEWYPNFSVLDGSNGFQIAGTANGQQIGWSLASGGDINGDGYSDIVIGSYDTTGAKNGLAYVVFGHSGAFAADMTGADLNGTNGFVLTSGTANALVGHSVASAGDVNGDGYGDLIIGARGGATTGGESFLLFGHAGGFSPSIDLDTMSATTGLKIGPVPITDGTGMVLPASTNVASAGDLNGDGYDDLALGVYAADPSGRLNAGSTYIVFGHAGFATAPDLGVVDGTHVVRIDGAKAGDGSGWSVGSAGDVNGDGYNDLIIGSHQTVKAGDPGVPGEAYVLYGHDGGFAAHIDLATLDAKDGFKIDGLGSTGFGMTVASAGDANGDGYADLVISDNAKNATYVIYGGNFTGAVDHLGTRDSDLFVGDGSDENFVADDGNDIINTNGGKDSVHAGAGSDQIHVADANFLHIDGGGGRDTLFFDFGGAIDFGDLHGKLDSIETINVVNGKANALTLRLADVLDMAPIDHDIAGGHPTLDTTIDGNVGDTLALSSADGWGAPNTTQPGYAIYSHEGIRLVVDTDIAVTVS